METMNGCLVLSKRQRSPIEGAEILVHPAAIVAIEPHRSGCYVYVGGHKFDVTHSHAEIAQAVEYAMRVR
jgi:hypothetical protein